MKTFQELSKTVTVLTGRDLQVLKGGSGDPPPPPPRIRNGG